jgi:hypothetical protein
MASTSPPRTFFAFAITIGLITAATFGVTSAASAATAISGPVNLGTAADYGVLGFSTVTNTGPTIVNGDVGLWSGTSITGFDVPGGPGTVNGTIHTTDADAQQGQADALTAYNVAASLSPTQSGTGQLAGLNLSPGVYNGGALNLSDNGALTLDGDANSVWVFQASSTLTIGSATEIIITGGASACNVFWQVGTSATINSGAQFRGTVLADQSVTAVTGATVIGRLIALNAAVTLDTNTITAPTGCPPAGTVSDTPAPEITSGEPTDATVGTPYEFTVTAEGTPTPTYSVTEGALPAGLSLDTDTGAISGTPTTPGDSTFTITATNQQTPDASAIYTITVAPAAVVTPEIPAPGGATGGLPASGSDIPGELAESGADPVSPLAAVLLLLAGTGLVLVSLRRRLSV